MLLNVKCFLLMIKQAKSTPEQEIFWVMEKCDLLIRSLRIQSDSGDAGGCIRICIKKYNFHNIVFVFNYCLYLLLLLFIVFIF